MIKWVRSQSPGPSLDKSFQTKLNIGDRRDKLNISPSNYDNLPCGSGTATRIAQLHHSGKLTKNMTLIHDSIIGSRFEGRIDQEQELNGTKGVIPVITGNAFCTGTSSFTLSENDEIGTGFSLR